MHAKDISALRPIPVTKQPRGFSVPENLSFRNSGRKPTSTRRKQENDDSSTEIPSVAGTIFGGNISQTGDQRRWQDYIENEETRGACGGTLISPTVVLTDNLSFQNCGTKPTSTRRKQENDDSSTEIPSINGQIFGGNISQTGDHPWHVYIENEVTGGACGGTLISPTVVLTAAHCIYGSKVEDFRVSLGMYDKRQRRAPGVQRRKPSSLIVHPKYDSAELISDVGLVILKTKVRITNNVRPICLWNDDSDSNLARVAGTKAMAVGFGLADNYTLPDKLQEVRLPILAHKECYLSKRGFFGKYLRPGDNFCAGYTNGTTTCNGDSGGSLSMEKNGRWFIRGIVSFGMSKKVKFNGEETLLCHPDQYSLFADVASYVDWIVENTPDISFQKIESCRWFSIFFGK